MLLSCNRADPAQTAAEDFLNGLKTGDFARSEKYLDSTTKFNMLDAAMFDNDNLEIYSALWSKMNWSVERVFEGAPNVKTVQIVLDAPDYSKLVADLQSRNEYFVDSVIEAIKNPATTKKSTSVPLIVGHTESGWKVWAPELEGALLN